MAATSAYSTPAIESTRRIAVHHLEELENSYVDVTTAGLAGVSSIDHSDAYDLGIRGEGSLAGIIYRYWEPLSSSFSRRFARIKPDIQVAGRKYLQPVGEKPRLYFIAGTTPAELADPRLSVFVVEGEKKALALDKALRELSERGLVVGIGGVWGWRCSPRELRPNGKLDKGKSRAIADLDRIEWNGRRAFLLFDSDVSTNWKVQAAETALARELLSRGAGVYLMRMGDSQQCRRSA